MRCTRCDGLVVPQAVGILPDDRVVFGWCLQCLADKECRLVEVNISALLDFKLTFSPTETVRRPSPEGASPARVDESQWIVAVVAFLMISWGLILLAAGLFSHS